MQLRFLELSPVRVTAGLATDAQLGYTSLSRQWTSILSWTGAPGSRL